MTEIERQVEAEADMDDDDQEYGHGFGTRWRKAVELGVVSIIRVSSPRQAIESQGSLRTQEDQVEVLVSRGIPRDQIRIVRLLGESASADADRPRFRAEVLDEAEAGRIGVLSMVRDDRGSRNGTDSEALYEALAENEGFVVVGDTIYEPGNSSQRMMLQIGSAVAEHENKQRAERTALDRFNLARECRMRISVTAGMTWLDPANAEHRTAVVAAGMTDWLDPKRLELYKANSVRDGRTLYLLPYPDADVVKATTLVLDWMFELRDTRAVVERMLHDPRWPRAGYYPVSRSSIYNQDRPHEWVPIKRAYGSIATAINHVMHWSRQPELYGVYEYRSGARKKRRRKQGTSAAAKEKREKAKKRVKVVLVRDACIGYRPSADWDAMCQLISAGPDSRVNRRSDRPRTHITPVMRCGHVMPDGVRCGYRMRPDYVHDKRTLSAVTACFERHGAFAVPQQLVDAVVLDAVLEAYQPESIAEVIGRVRRESKGGHRRRKKILEAIEKAQRAVKRSRRLQLQAEEDGDQDDAGGWHEERQGYKREIKRLKRDLEDVDAEESVSGSLKASEVAALMALASDLADLMPRAALIPGKARELMAELVGEVHIRPLAKYVFLVEIAFPAGGVVRRVAVSRPMFATQPVHAFAALRLEPYLERWVRGTDVGMRDELLAAAGIVGHDLAEVLDGVRRARPFTPWRVLGAALVHKYGPHQPTRPGRHESVEELAARTGEPLAVVMRAVLMGTLGPAVHTDGWLAVAPTTAELHRNLPGYAHREVARLAGWPPDDTVLAHEVAGQLGVRTSVVVSVCTARGEVLWDEARRRYVRLSESPLVRPMTVEAAVREAGPEFEALAPEHWRFLADVLHDIEGVASNTVLTHAPHIKPGWGPKGPHSWLVWLGPEVRERLRQAAAYGAAHMRRSK